MRLALAVAAVALSTLLLVVPLHPASDDDAPLTEEDVVRMFVSGASAEEMVQRIKSSQTAFALDEGMLEELGHAGLPAVVIEAMIERQRELDPPPPEPEEVAATELTALPVLRVRLNPDAASGEESEARLSVSAAIPPGTREQLRLRPEVERYTDVAIFLACLTADHVPDHWRSKSPLGRDFISMPRHRILTFRAGSTAGEEGTAGTPGDDAEEGAETDSATLVELAVPETLIVELDLGVAHDLLLGVALLAGDRWYRVQSATAEGTVLGAEGLEIGARIWAPRKPGAELVRIRFLDP